MSAVRVAEQWLAARAGITLAPQSGEANRGAKTQLVAITRQAAEWYHGQLLNNAEAQPARDYLLRQRLAELGGSSNSATPPPTADGLAPIPQLELTAIRLASQTGDRRDLWWLDPLLYADPRARSVALALRHAATVAEAFENLEDGETQFRLSQVPDDLARAAPRLAKATT